MYSSYFIMCKIRPFQYMLCFGLANEPLKAVEVFEMSNNTTAATKNIILVIYTAKLRSGDFFYQMINTMMSC